MVRSSVSATSGWLKTLRRQNAALNETADLVKPRLAQVDRLIAEKLHQGPAPVQEAGAWVLQAGGKRLRPTVLLAAARALGCEGDAAVTYAAVVEMIHTATLAHDDVIDVAQTRRGRPSPNVIWGNHTSVLAGDWLYMQAFQVTLRERNFEVLDLLISLTQRMVEGELLQLELIGSIGVSEADYMELVDRKTASLFSSCARLGAMVAGAGEQWVTRLGEFAWNLGMAFQLVDDVLDFTAREKVLGKPVGNDLREGKVTLPLIYALETAGPEDRKLVETVLEEGNYDRVPFRSVLEMMERRRGVERVMERAQMFTGKARTILGEFPESPYQKALYAVTDLVTDRDH